MAISKSAKIGENTIIQEDVSIGIYPSEGKVEIGKNGIIRSGSIIYSGVKIGNQLRTGHNILVREKSIIGDNVLIGTNSVIDGNCKIGSNVAIQTGAYVTVNAVIEDDVFLGPYVITTNDKYIKNPQLGENANLAGPVIKKGARIGANAVILPGVTIGEGAIIGAGTVVSKDVPPKETHIGNPNRIVK